VFTSLQRSQSTLMITPERLTLRNTVRVLLEWATMEERMTVQYAILFNVQSMLLTPASQFGEVFISSPNAGSVSSLTLAADWVITDCNPTSDQEQKVGTHKMNSHAEQILTTPSRLQVSAYCTLPIDHEDSGCGHVFIDGAKDTIIRMPKSCGLGPYARVVSLELHHNQSSLDARHAKRAQSDVYLLHFDYNFAAVPSSNGPVL